MDITCDQTGVTRHHCDQGYGQPKTDEYAFIRGKSYTLQLRWTGTNRSYEEGPDYDWCLLINGSDATGLCQGLYNTGPFIIGDSDGLLTPLTDGGPNNLTLGREVKIFVPETWLEFVHAEGDDKGEPIDQLPVFTPQDGTGKGVPIYDCPGVDFDFSIWAMAGFPRFAYVMWLGLGFALEETAPGSNVFEAAGWASLTLLEPPLDDPGVQEQASVMFSCPYYGITNAVYTCT